jgi:hypothetical protein
VGSNGHEPPEECWYRIELREGDETRPLGEVTCTVPHRSVLDPWASRLRREGGTGELVMIDKGTEELVAYQDLAAVPRWQGRTRMRDLSPVIATVAARDGKRRPRRRHRP